MSAEKSERILTILFDAEISFSEIPFFRGAVIQTLKQQQGDVNVLFHNHNGQQFRFSYPLIQYKRIHNKAAIVSIGEGADIIGSFLSSMKETIQLRERIIPLHVEDVVSRQIAIRPYETSFNYSVRRWLPLNSKNHAVFSAIDNLTEKVAFLEKTLIGNILSMGKGLNIRFDDEIRCKIQELKGPYLSNVKNTAMTAFDARFNTNICLPAFIGLGKHTSIGYGMISPVK